MCVLDRKEVGKLSLMYEGDKARDASDKIRGFLFQDYITIKCLLQNGVEYVCSEYLEDVDVFYEDGRFEFIQVKYYPKTSPNMDEISTDLYYQYLRLRMLQSKLTAIPKLYIHRKPTVKKPTLEEMKGYVKLGKVFKHEAIDPQTATLQEWKYWLNKNVYLSKKKEEQKKILFESMASEASLKEFVDKITISHQSNITQYKQELMEELAKVYPNPDQAGNKEHWKLILLGLTISYIQRRYTLVDPGFDQLRVKRTEFDQYILESTQTKTSQTIASYLMGVVSGEYAEIVKQNELSDLQLDMLNRIFKKTLQWVGNIGSTVDGQYQLLNTLSKDEVCEIVGYRDKAIDEKLSSIAECKYAFTAFLGYLWKIMLNICQDKINSQMEMEQHSELFDPNYYLESSVTDYVCLHFPEDKYASHSVILPPATEKPKRVKRRIADRMIKMSQKPEKWFFKNDSFKRGKNSVTYSVANIKENSTVADPEEYQEYSFYIECMKCIQTDEGDWNEPDPCGKCIFSEECAEGGMK